MFCRLSSRWINNFGFSVNALDCVFLDEFSASRISLQTKVGNLSCSWFDFFLFLGYTFLLTCNVNFMWYRKWFKSPLRLCVEKLVLKFLCLIGFA